MFDLQSFLNSLKSRIRAASFENRQIQFIRYTSLMLLVPYLVYAFYNALIQNWPFVFLPLLAAAILILINIKLLDLSSIKKVTYLLIILIYGFALISLIIGNKQYYSLIWMAGIPVITYPLLGYKTGFKINAAFWVFLLFFFLALPRDILPYRSAANVLFLVFYLILALYSYEKSFETAQSALEEKHRDLERISSTDALTGLYNRMRIDKYIEDTLSLIEPAPSSSSNFWCLMLVDIDSFKNINDTYGHLQGDQALKAVSVTLSSTFKETGMIARWGGEEFLIFLNETSLFHTNRLAETLRHNIEQIQFNNDMKITVSIGISAYRLGDSYDTLLKRADDCLYKAKKQGRNQIICEL